MILPDISGVTIYDFEASFQSIKDLKWVIQVASDGKCWQSFKLVQSEPCYDDDSFVFLNARDAY